MCIYIYIYVYISGWECASAEPALSKKTQNSETESTVS